MDSIRKALRSGAVEKDMYGRLKCSNCSQELTTENDPEEVGSIRVCPDCETKWKELA